MNYSFISISIHFEYIYPSCIHVVWYVYRNSDGRIDLANWLRPRRFARDSDCSVLFCSVLSCPVLPCPVLLGSIVILLYSLHTLFYTYIHIVCICMLYVGMYMRFCRFGLRQSRQRRRNFSFQQDRSIIKYVSKWVTIAGWFVHFLNFKQKGKNYVPM